MLQPAARDIDPAGDPDFLKPRDIIQKFDEGTKPRRAADDAAMQPD